MRINPDPMSSAGLGAADIAFDRQGAADAPHPAAPTRDRPSVALVILTPRPWARKSAASARMTSRASNCTVPPVSPNPYPHPRLYWFVRTRVVLEIITRRPPRIPCKQQQVNSYTRRATPTLRRVPLPPPSPRTLPNHSTPPTPAVNWLLFKTI